MSAAIDAVYQNGVFRPVTPPDLPDGTAVRLAILPAPPVFAPPDLPPPDPAKALARILATVAKFDPATDHPEVTSANVDAILYGRPGDPGDVR